MLSFRERIGESHVDRTKQLRQQHEKFGWADYAKPASIDIYPKDFESKQSVIDILDNYNEAMNAAGEEDKVVSYTDIVGALMSSVTTIVNMISYVLMAFVAISLVVSSIMIGIITYISVLERKKEIGVLRSIGASKGDISRVFTPKPSSSVSQPALLASDLRLWLHSRQHDCLFIVRCGKHRDSAMASRDCLDWHKLLLTFLAGLIPSSAAAKKDPVEALRSE